MSVMWKRSVEGEIRAEQATDQANTNCSRSTQVMIIISWEEEPRVSFAYQRAGESLAEISLFKSEELFQLALEKKLPLEVILRIRRLLSRMDPITPRSLQKLRAIAVMENIGSWEAERVLKRIARGEFNERVKQNAREALLR